MIKGIAHVALTVNDLERSVEFYTRVFGFTHAFDLHHPNGEIMLTYLRISGRQFIELFPAGENSIDGSRYAGHISFEVDDLGETIDTMQKEGVEVLVKPKTGRDGCRQAWVADPDRYRIELIEVRPSSLQAKAIE